MPFCLHRGLLPMYNDMYLLEMLRRLAKTTSIEKKIEADRSKR